MTTTIRDLKNALGTGLGSRKNKYLLEISFADIDSAKLNILCKTASLPQKDFNELTTEYMGSKIVYPGKATVAGTLEVTFDEFQDLYISKALHRWQNLLFNQGFQNDIDAIGITGGASSNFLKDYSATVRVVLYDSSLKSKLPVEYKFYYVWPKTVSQVALGQEQAEKIQRSVTFNYSTYEMIATGE